MILRHFFVFLLCLFCLQNSVAKLFDGRQIDDNEVVTFFPSYGHWNEETKQWDLRIEAKIYEPKENTQLIRTIIAAIELYSGEEVTDIDEFWQRIGPFVADNERFEKITIRIGEAQYPLPRSKASGRISGVVSVANIDLGGLKDENNWVEILVDSEDGREFIGKIQLIQENGISVISDIDDTIKITGIVAGTKEMVKNTFLRPTKIAPGMPFRYAELAKQNIKFHYLSGSPNQLYGGLLAPFIVANYPLGSVSLKEFRVNPLSQEFWKAIAKRATEKQKKAEIKRILNDFPKRTFILIGDTGEHDPEIYAWALTSFPAQIRQVMLRNVSSEALTNARFQTIFADQLDKVILLDEITAMIQK